MVFVGTREKIVTQAQVQRQARGDLEIVLNVGAILLRAKPRCSGGQSLLDLRGSPRQEVGEGVSGKERRENIGALPEVVAGIIVRLTMHIDPQLDGVPASQQGKVVAFFPIGVSG